MKEFREILTEHLDRYPAMTGQDCCKLAFQHVFGPEHMAPDAERVRNYLRGEWAQCEADYPSAEDIGNGLCRLHLGGEGDDAAVGLLSELFLRTAGSHRGSRELLEKALAAVEERMGADPFLSEWRRAGCPAIHHSESFRESYSPHYRVISADLGRWFPALLAVKCAMAGRERTVVAVDGRCGSGKTSFAAAAQEVFGCTVFHTDDYYLPFDRREENWEQIPAGNMDLERLREEVLLPACAGETVHYRPYDCGSGKLKEECAVLPSRLVILEGSYSHHPALAEHIDLRIFLTCSSEEQTKRLMEREGDYYPMFPKRWIPMEERYYRAFDIEKNCDLILNTER